MDNPWLVNAAENSLTLFLFCLTGVKTALILSSLKLKLISMGTVLVQNFIS